MKQFILNMRRIAIGAALLASMATARAQVTPQAVVANAPSLPAPEQWAANGGHTEAFRTKIAELNQALGKIQAEAIPTISADEMAAAKEKQEKDLERQRKQSRKDAQRGMQEAASMGFTQADLQRMGTMSEKELEAFVAQKMAASPQTQAMKAMGFTDADMQKMQNMSERQGEAYAEKRMAELGITEEEFRRRMAEAGAIVLSPEEEAAARRSEREAEKKGNAMRKAQETQQAYMDQTQVASGKIAEAENNAKRRVDDLWKSSKPAIDAALEHLGELGGPEEIMRGTITKEQYNSRVNRVREAYDTYNVGAYRIWHEYVLAAQGHLKFLMPYAQAADDAQREQARAMNTGNATMAKLQGMSNYAITLAAQYLKITESEPRMERSSVANL
ncbi:MAG: hypothetical protein LBN29_14030 [Mediterranea sp.]|jgi:hypothetical protein|nr:hypothetical protein [Mediterranea sp.]